MSGFKKFLLRGNVVDLAVAVVIGAALVALVTSVVEGVINPVLGAVFSADSLNDALDVTLPGGAVLKFGMVIGALINFVIVAAIVYFGLVRPVSALRDRFAPAEDSVAGPSETELLAEIRDLLKAQRP